MRRLLPWLLVAPLHAAAADIVVTRVNPPAVPGQFSNIVQLNPNTVQLLGSGGSNASYNLLANTNLATTNWVNIGTVPTDSLGQFLFNDTNALLFPQRFFRLKTP